MTTRTTPPPAGGWDESDPDRSVSDRPTWVLPYLPAVPRVTAVPLNDLGEMGQPAKPTVPFERPATLAPTPGWDDGEGAGDASLDLAEVGTMPFAAPAELRERLRVARTWIERHLGEARALRREATRLDGEITCLMREQRTVTGEWEKARGWVSLTPRAVRRLSERERRIQAEAQARYVGLTDTVLEINRSLASARAAWAERVERAKEHERAAYALRLAAESEARAWG